ncbi:TonB-dependent receptor [bacterium]|nr:TonB-dependent receptor [bacterium]
MKYLTVLIALTLLFSNTPAQNMKGIISGKIVDEVSKEPIPGVNVQIIGSTLGASTNLEGDFQISNVEIGTYQIRISAVGYQTIIKPDVIVNSARPTDLMIKLTTSLIEFNEITVRSDYFEMDPSEIGGVTHLSYEEIRRTPGGFEDVVRALSILPGVAQASAGRNDLIVRGGAPSENLYIVDGFVVPNINHFGSQGATGGPLSFINLDFVRETSFSSGGFSSLYGDKLSSVLTIDTRDGRKDRLGGKGTIAASQFGLNLEGPIGRKGDFILSVRRSYLDFIFNAAGFNFVPEYYDALTKFTFDLDEKNRISYLFIGAFDKVKFNNKDSEDFYENSRILGSNQNTYVSGLSYRHLFEKGFFNISLSRNFTDFDSSQRDTLLNPIFLNKSREGENELKGDLIYKVSSTSELNIGASTKLIKFSADIKLPNFITTFGERLSITSLNTQRNFTKLGLYTQYSNTMLDKFRINVGVRGDYFSEISTSFYVSPRFAIAYMFSDLASINFSAGVYHQSPSYIWLVADEQNKNLKAVRVNQFVLGYERRLQDDIRMKVEGFYKEYKNYPASVLRPYLVLANTGAGYGGGDENFASFGLEKLVSSGSGEVHGVELSIQKKSSDTPLYGIISATWSESNFKALDGVKRSGSFGQNWIVNLTAGYIFNKKWEASMKFRFATGNPYTPFNNDGTQSVANYNTGRFNSLHSLDLRVDRRWDFEGWALITYIDIQNIYNNKNTNNIRWDYRKGMIDDQSSIGLLPSIGVSMEF